MPGDFRESDISSGAMAANVTVTNKTWPYFAMHTAGSPDTTKPDGASDWHARLQSSTLIAITFEESVLKSTFSRNYPVWELSGPNTLHSTATIHVFLWENM